MQTLTEDQKKDVSSRIEKFQTALEALQTEHQVEIQAFPQYIPTPQGFTTLAQVGLRDTKFAPVKSPFGPNGIIQEGK